LNVLLVGGGGREHAIAAAIKKSGHKLRLYTAMSKKNPGIARLSEDILLVKETEVENITEYAKQHNIEFAFIGPEAPLAAGITDALEAENIPVFGPSKSAARIEFDKAWTRDFMQKHNIKGCPRFKVFDQTQKIQAHEFIDELQDVAIKPAGLTGGKGVRVTGDHLPTVKEAKQYTDEVLKKDRVVVEERLIGEEFTLQAFSDGEHLAFTPAVQDHKRAFDGDRGPNTGGMGSYSDKTDTLPFMSDTELEAAKQIMQQTLDALNSEGITYKGLLYGQFMLTAKGPMVIEYNARFGDPEAMNTLPLLQTDIIDLAEHITRGNLHKLKVNFERKATVCKYLVPEGYPDNPVADSEITITPPKNNTLLFYSSVYEQNGKIYTTTSRAVAVVGIAETLQEAEQLAQQAAENIKGKLYHRADIGTQPLIQQRINHMRQLRGM
jgi:phosphoribosylamine--glycine ligase